MDENSNFLDKNTIMAIVLSIVFFIGWQSYVQNKYPDANKNKVTQQIDQETTKDVNSNTNKEMSVVEPGVEDSISEEKIESNIPNKKFTVLSFSNGWNYSLSSLGMGIDYFELVDYTNRESEKIRFEDPTRSTGIFATYFEGKPVPFLIEKKSDVRLIGTARLNKQTIIKEMIFSPETFTVSVSIKTVSGNPERGEKIETKISNKVLKVKSSMFTPAYEGTEFFTINDDSEERERLDVESAYNQSFNKATLTSIGSQYFALAVNDESPVIPVANLSFDPKTQVAYASLVYPADTEGNKTNISFTGFVGPKKYDILKGLQPNFVKMINYGMFSVLSKPMLTMLKWLYGMFENWGLAIILLTIFIRMLLLPINVSSLKSMKKMQKIQPQLKAIKEKYKEDPQRVNTETMALMKKEKANPLGGCLPMLLQLPVFLALYSVLGQSVELYKSPFIFWIKDLSYQDPFFVLPVAVGVLYFIQMSITPQPTDPAQAKVMKFIPILFCFFMITVPSGLTLYFFVNTVFGIGQSYIFQREKKKAAA